MVTKNKRLTVLSEAEQFALYGLPDFDYNQRMQYLFLTDGELSLALNRPDIPAQVHCVLQIGYFKAKHAFFKFSWEDTQEDLAFIVSRYFNGQVFVPQTITDHEYYKQREIIVDFFGYRLWSSKLFIPQLAQLTAQIVRRDVTPGFIVAELTGRTDIEIEISNQCARLIANAIIYYNSAILSRLLVKYEADQNQKTLDLIKKISPVAWRNIHLNGHYTFRSSGRSINLDEIVAGLVLK